ncbi:TlpA family protein disulfide reductase [Streptomyces megasporus]|uniref:TlpA family protein disulfide reductase n=1 Tax=Streptomyces megasporus TaxID=44060 RepID=UPI0004E15A4A|nr:TlpA disulfide reductase family protein [Streptomyces megasporus]
MTVSSRGGARIPRRTALAALPLAVLAAVGCAPQSEDAPSGGEAADRRQLLHIPAADRQAAPDVRGETLTGEELALADFRGKIVVLNVWGSWCAPCRAEAPHLQKVSQATKDQGVVFLGINTRDATRDNALNFEESYGITYPSLWDPAGRQLLKFKGTLAPSAIPSTVAIDRKGRIAARALKALDETELRWLIDPVLKEG